MNDKLLNNFRKTILRVVPKKSDFDALANLFSSMEKDEAEQLNEVFTQKPFLIREIIENIKIKKIIFKNNNSEEWQNIMKIRYCAGYPTIVQD